VPHSTSVSIAAAQMAATPLAPTANLARVTSFVADAHARGARLVVFPEMTNTGYVEHADLHALAEDHAGPTIRTCLALSQRYGVYIACGFVEFHERDVYNSLAFVTPRGELSIYRKRHLIFWEHYYFRPGLAPLIVETELGRIGFAICADIMYDHVWAQYRGLIDLAVISAAWPCSTAETTGNVGWILQPSGRLAEELPVQIARTLTCPVVFCNHCGPCEVRIPMMGTQRAAFAGKTAVYYPSGTSASNPLEGEGVALAAIPVPRRSERCATLSG
jgi:predicted amidohydrolase